MSINKFSLPPAFGGETKDFNADDARRGARKNSITTRRFTNNIGKALGYIPLVGTVVGIARAVDTCFLLCDYEVSGKNLAGRVVRSGVETFSLGIIFLPIDLGVTLYRFIKSSDSSEPKPDLTKVDPRSSSDIELHPSAAHLLKVGDESESSTSSRASGSAKPPITPPINENKNPEEEEHKGNPKRVAIGPAAPPASADSMPWPGQLLVRLPPGPAAVLPPAAPPVAELPPAAPPVAELPLAAPPVAELPLAVRPVAVPPAAVDLPRGMLKSTTLVDLDLYNHPYFSTAKILGANPNFTHDYAKIKFTRPTWDHNVGVKSSPVSVEMQVDDFNRHLKTALMAWLELQEVKADLIRTNEWKEEEEDLTEIQQPAPPPMQIIPPPPPPPPPPRSAGQANKEPQMPKQKTLAAVVIREKKPIERYYEKLSAYYRAIQTLSDQLFPLHQNTIFIHKGELIDPEIENAIDIEEAQGLIDRIKAPLLAPKQHSPIQPKKSELTAEQRICDLFLKKKNEELNLAIRAFNTAEDMRKNVVDPYMMAQNLVEALEKLPKTRQNMLRLDEALITQKECLKKLNEANLEELDRIFHEAQERRTNVVVEIQRMTGISQGDPNKLQTQITNLRKGIKEGKEGFLQSEQYKVILKNAQDLKNAEAKKLAPIPIARATGERKKN